MDIKGDSISSVPKCVTRTEHQRSDARVVAPDISFRTNLSPQVLGMIFMRWRFLTNCRFRRFVVHRHPEMGDAGIEVFEEAGDRTRKRPVELGLSLPDQFLGDHL